MNPVDETPTDRVYRDFGEHQTDDSPCFQAWALALADDREILDRVDTLPVGKRQPNLVFAAARWHGAEPGPYDGLRTVLTDQWDRVEATVLARATQTNEVGRCATLLPVLAGLPGPLALLEVGCSAGLCLYPDRYSYRFTRPGSGDGEGADEVVALDPVDGPSPVVLPCEVRGDVPLPDALPEVVWRGGIDLNPLDVRDDDAMRWLRTLVWPEHDDRRARLDAAVALVRDDPPMLERGDLVDGLPELVDQVPEDTTLVVFHSAVLAYVPAPERVRFLETVAGVHGHWVSNEGPDVVPGLVATTHTEPSTGTLLGSAPFLLGLDGRAVAWTQGHGRAMRWI